SFATAHGRAALPSPQGGGWAGADGLGVRLIERAKIGQCFQLLAIKERFGADAFGPGKTPFFPIGDDAGVDIARAADGAGIAQALADGVEHFVDLTGPRGLAFSALEPGEQVKSADSGRPCAKML